MGSRYHYYRRVFRLIGFDRPALTINYLEMIQGEPPYIDIETMKVLDLIKTVGVPPISDAHRLSAPLRDFLEKTVDMDYNRRPSSTQLLKVRISPVIADPAC